MIGEAARSRLSCALIAIACLFATRVAAQEAPSAIARGRGLGWGVTAIAPLYLGPVRARDGREIHYLAPGGGVEGRVFYELANGIGLGALGGVAVHASTNTRALAAYRAAAEARWVIEIGMPELAPLVAVSIGALVAQAGAETVVTGYARLAAGAQIVLAPWAAIEISVALEGALGASAFADAIAWITPQAGVIFHE